MLRRENDKAGLERPVEGWRGQARIGRYRKVRRVQAWLGVSRFGSAGETGFGKHWSGIVWQDTAGEARPVSTGLVLAGGARRCWSRLGTAQYGEER